jgi:hypothetical protein
MDNPSQHPQRFFRFSLRTLLLFVVAASLALAAMRYANYAWASGVVTVTVLMLLASVTLAATCSGEVRLYWIGFAICGVGYLLFVTGFANILAPELVMRLATTQSVAFLRDQFHSPSDYQYTEVIPNGYSQMRQTVTPQPPKRPLLRSQVEKQLGNWADESYQTMAESFLLIGHCIWALIIAALGGALARFAARRATLA